MIVTGCPESKKRNGSPRLARPGFLGKGYPGPSHRNGRNEVGVRMAFLSPPMSSSAYGGQETLSPGRKYLQIIKSGKGLVSGI